MLTTCALGAAFQAGEIGSKESDAAVPFRGSQSSGKQVVDVPEDWLTVLHTEHECPQCERHDPLYRLIPHLNDDHQWKREEIALLVQRVEDRQYQEAGKVFIEPDEVDEVDEVLEAHVIGG